jgi:Tfp pilus assembly protein PilO
MKGLTPIIIIVVSILGFIFFLRPQYAVIKDLKAEEVKYDGVLDQAAELNALRDRLEKTVETFAPEDLERLNKLVPESIDLPRLALDITTMANAFGLETEGLAISEPLDSPQTPNSKSYRSSRIEFTTDSSYDVMVAFLKELEQSLRLLDVSSLAVSPSEESATGLFKFNISIQTYWVDPSAQKASQEAAITDLDNN